MPTGCLWGWETVVVDHNPAHATLLFLDVLRLLILLWRLEHLGIIKRPQRKKVHGLVQAMFPTIAQ